MQIPISIIVPTLNEEKYLPRLLESLKKQTYQPAEIIVVDARSNDKTRQIARQYGCKVVQTKPGIAAQRNLGAKIASQSLLLFLDADIMLPKHFLEKAYGEFKHRKLDIASCPFKPLSDETIDIILHKAANYYLRIMQDILASAPGYCILVKKSLHNRIRGFDAAFIMAEDRDYAKRAGKVGTFAYLNSTKVFVSIRRLEEEGRLKLILKYLAAELQFLLVGKVHKTYFDYKFGEHYYDN